MDDDDYYCRTQVAARRPQSLHSCLNLAWRWQSRLDLWTRPLLLLLLLLSRTYPKRKGGEGNEKMKVEMMQRGWPDRRRRESKSVAIRAGDLVSCHLSFPHYFSCQIPHTHEPWRSVSFLHEHEAKCTPLSVSLSSEPNPHRPVGRPRRRLTTHQKRREPS